MDEIQKPRENSVATVVCVCEKSTLYGIVSPLLFNKRSFN